MAELRPVEDVWNELSEVDTTDEVALGIIQADREARVERCSSNVVAALQARGYHESDGLVVDVIAAIHAVATPPDDTTRERLGRVAYGVWYPVKMWMDLTEESREQQRVVGDTVRAELDKIREEQKL